MQWYSWHGSAEDIVQVLLFMCFEWSVKEQCIEKVTKSIRLFPFSMNQKQECRFQGIGGLVTKNASGFYRKWMTLDFKGMPISTDF